MRGAVIEWKGEVVITQHGITGILCTIWKDSDPFSAGVRYDDEVLLSSLGYGAKVIKVLRGDD